MTTEYYVDFPIDERDILACGRCGVVPQSEVNEKTQEVIYDPGYRRRCVECQILVHWCCIEWFGLLPSLICVGCWPKVRKANPILARIGKRNKKWKKRRKAISK